MRSVRIAFDGEDAYGFYSREGYWVEVERPKPGAPHKLTHAMETKKFKKSWRLRRKILSYGLSELKMFKPFRHFEHFKHFGHFQTARPLHILPLLTFGAHDSTMITHDGP